MTAEITATLITIFITSLLACISFLFVRWMNSTDERLDDCHDSQEKNEKRIDKIEDRTVTHEEFLTAVHKLENADNEQKTQIYQLEGRTADMSERLKNIEKSRKEK